jgi:type IV pilus assembly protein PilY1
MTQASSLLPKRVSSFLGRAWLALTGFAWGVACAAPTPLADQPLFSTSSVPGNLALVLSVEFPTAVSVAHIDTTYNSAKTYLGYFDPAKCYAYQYDASVNLNNYFYPTGTPVGGSCGGKWSGNFLNWATMQTIDPFRWALTGGYRVIDEPARTVLERAYASGQGGTGNFPDRSLSSAVSANTPFTWSTLYMRVQGLGNKLRFAGTNSGSNNVNNPNPAPVAYNPASAVNNNTVYELYIRVKVCDPSLGVALLESNCKGYANGNYKPEGLLQKYASRIRYSAFGYLNDSNVQRDGGVLRARQKFIAPMKPVPGSPDVSNTAREWDPATGVFTLNPDATDAADTQTLFGVPVTNSGVVNYLNKFGEVNPGSYKSYDPVSELYYAAVRYFKKLGNVPEWTNMSTATTAAKTTYIDGFPVITNWDDPILYSCQKNFILGIGDVNTHADKNVPGNTPTTNEPTKPALVVADTTVNAVTATNKVGVLEGLGGSLGTTNPYNGCCTNNSALIAGLAYDSHTKDIRPDLPDLNGIPQTIDTYWLDVLEFSAYKNTNQYYLAAKYGGFKVPQGYDPYANTTALPQSWWSTNGDTLGSPAQPRPDNYYVASRPDTMVSGLTNAFAAIAASLKSVTTSFSTSLPQVHTSGNASFSAKYDASAWTGEVVASELVFPSNGSAPQLTQKWNFTDVLSAQAAGTGWDTGRRIVSFNSSTRSGVAFRLANLATAQQSALNTPYKGSDAANYLNYLRGDRTNEQASTVTGSTKAYRTRVNLVGDIVNAKARPVSAPNFNYSDSANPGYSAFRLSKANRPTVVYVGANDGMMHAINGALTGAGAGQEIFAYVPAAVISGPNNTPGVDGLAALGNPNFTHHYYVDGQLDVFDIDFSRTAGSGSTSPDWHSVLIGGLGKGGKSYYAIDVTDPAAFTSEGAAAGKILWEFTDPDLGYTYGDVGVVKTRQYGWVVVFVSGYNNADGKGYFFVVNPRTGQLLQKISTGSGSLAVPAGLAHVNGFVPDRTDGTVDAAYAGDLQGNLWRLDLTAATGNYPAPVLIATLADPSGNPQPVTSRPLIEIDPATLRRYVLIGTGRLLDPTDIASTQIQSYYAIRDGDYRTFNRPADLPTGVSFPIRRSNMVPNTDLSNGVNMTAATTMGWYLDLGQANGNTGPAWRVILDSTVLLGQVGFAPMLPNGDACSPSGTSRIYGVEFGTGKSILLDAGNATIAYNNSLTGVVTDLRFFSVSPDAGQSGGAGKSALVGGTDKGGLDNIKKRQLPGAGLRRLNWREVPTTN